MPKKSGTDFFQITLQRLRKSYDNHFVKQILNLTEKQRKIP